MGTKNARLALVALLVVGLVSCSPKAPEHTTAWYQAHPDVAKARIGECDRLALSDRDADCVNAQQGATMAALHGGPTINPWTK